MKARILQTLSDLRAYGLTKPCEIELFYHEEDSTLMRFANSAVSLNTSEHLIRLEITATDGRKRASYEMITDLDHVDEMKEGIDIAAEMVEHVQPLAYDPTVPVFETSFADEGAYDRALAEINSADKLATFNVAVAGLESPAENITAGLQLSGIFSSGVNTVAQINTRSEHSQFFRTTDAQVTVVLAHNEEKWEVQAERSAQQKAEIDPQPLRRRPGLPGRAVHPGPGRTTPPRHLRYRLRPRGDGGLALVYELRRLQRRDDEARLLVSEPGPGRAESLLGEGHARGRSRPSGDLPL